MPRYKQLELIRRVAHERAVGARGVAMTSQQVLQDNKTQLAQLIAYRAEYNARFLVDGGSGMSANQLAGYREFLTSLDQAISAQDRIIEENVNQWNSNRSLWQKIQAHEQALENVVNRRVSDEIRRQEKKEQIASDERAQSKGAKHWY
jgi:flagellar FliJ protein